MFGGKIGVLGLMLLVELVVVFWIKVVVVLRRDREECNILFMGLGNLYLKLE